MLLGKAEAERACVSRAISCGHVVAPGYLRDGEAARTSSEDLAGRSVRSGGQLNDLGVIRGRKLPKQRGTADRSRQV